MIIIAIRKFKKQRRTMSESTDNPKETTTKSTTVEETGDLAVDKPSTSQDSQVVAVPETGLKCIVVLPGIQNYDNSSSSSDSSKTMSKIMDNPKETTSEITTVEETGDLAGDKPSTSQDSQVVGVPETGLKCIAILPGIGNYDNSSSSDSSMTMSKSTDNPKETTSESTTVEETGDLAGDKPSTSQDSQVVGVPETGLKCIAILPGIGNYDHSSSSSNRSSSESDIETTPLLPKKDRKKKTQKELRAMEKGFGLGLLASGTFLVINDYFTTKKSTAVGISMAGTAVGQMTMPIFIGMLLKKYEYSGTTFILGFLSYSGVIGAMCFKPILCCKRWAPSDDVVAVENGTEKSPVNGKIVNEVKSLPKPEEEKLLPKVQNAERKLSINDRLNDERKTSLDERKLTSGDRKVSAERKVSTARGMIKSYSQVILKSHIEENYRESSIEMANSQFQLKHEEKKENCFRKIAKALGFDLLKDPIYVHIVVGLGLVYVSTVSFGAFFPLFLQDEANLSLYQTTTTMTSLSSGDVLGRITASEICRRMKMDNRKTFMFGAFLLAATRSVEISMPNYISLAVVAFIVGYFRSIAVINQNLVISEYISKEKLPSAVGLNMVTKAVLTLTVGQGLGLLKDLWSYRVCIHALNVVTVIVIVSWSLDILIRKMRESKKTETVEVNSVEANNAEVNS